MKKQQLGTIIEGVRTILRGLEGLVAITNDVVTEEEPNPKAKKEKKEAKKSVVPDESKQLDKKKGKIKKNDEEAEEANLDLDNMAYNELKKACKTNGLDAKGTKDDLIARLKEHLGIEDEEVEDEDIEEEVEDEEAEDAEEEEDGANELEDVLGELELKELKSIAKKLKVKVPVKITKDKLIAKLLESDIMDFLIENGYVEEDIEEENPYTEIEDMEDEDLKELLNSIGKSTKGKHQALVARVIKAIEDGELELGDDEVEDEEEEEEVKVEYVGTKKRLKAIENLDQELRESYEAEEITDKEIKKFLVEIYNGKFDTSDLEDNLEEYIRVQCELIDDDGEQNDLAEAYFVGDDVYCCGHATKEVDGSMVCEHCGTEWEV